MALLPVCRLGALLVLTTMTAATQTGNWNLVKALPRETGVRVMSGSRTVLGEIDRTTDEVLVLTSGTGQEMFDRQQVSAVSVKKPGHRKRNALIGLAAGAGVGLGTGIAARDSAFPKHRTSIMAVFTVVGALGGTIVGAILPTGGWREVYRN